MGHYDDCRDGYCGCGQPEGVIWACGREGCYKYHTWLLENNQPAYKKLMVKLREMEESHKLKKSMTVYQG